MGKLCGCQSRQCFRQTRRNTPPLPHKRILSFSSGGYQPHDGEIPGIINPFRLPLTNTWQTL